MKAQPIDVSVEILAVIVRGGPGHKFGGSYDLVVTGVCDSGHVRLKGFTSDGRLKREYLRATRRRLKELGLRIEGWERVTKSGVRKVRKGSVRGTKSGHHAKLA